MKKNHQIKLQTKFFLAYLGLALLVVIAFSIFFYRYTSNILIERETKAAADMNLSFLQQTEQILQDMDSVSINIGYSNLVKDRLAEANDLRVSSDDFMALADLFVTINGADLKVDQINLYDFSGSVVQVGIKNNSKKMDMDTLPWLTQTKELGGKKLLSLPYATTEITSNSNTSRTPVWYMSLYRVFHNRYKKQVGAIETVKKCSTIFKYITSYQQKNADAPSVYIYDKNGTLVFPYKLEESEQKSLPDYFSSIDSTLGHASFFNDDSRTTEILVSTSSSYTGWTYVTVQPQNHILQPVRNLIHVLGLGVAAMLACSVFISWYLSRSLTKPIKQLRNIIKKTALDTLGQQKQEPLDASFDELEELNQAFLSMSSNLKTSMDELIDTRQQEIKSRSLALQSQINPHFYYNTLSGIIVLAENNQSDEVVKMCRNLTKIMRYITKGDSSSVTLVEESEYIQEYLYCMKVRYQSSLNYEIHVDESLLSLKIPKLSIQPLVENALKYGTNCEPPWSLTIQSRITEDSWQIDIIDSGTGFTEESIQLIHSRIEAAAAKPGMPEIEINGMGMLNVYLRWKLFCGDDIIFKYGNTKDGHGIVSIGRKTSREHV